MSRHLFQKNTSTGGIFSTVKDQLAFGRGILRSQLLAPALTRRWLKPWSFGSSSSLRDAVGAPWEIARLTTLPAPVTRGRVVDLYTKSGGLSVVYASQLVLVPDYNLVLSALFGFAPSAPAVLPTPSASNASSSDPAATAATASSSSSVTPSATAAATDASNATAAAADAGLSAGSMLGPRYTLVLARLLPVAEQIARQQATANYAGLYTVALSSSSSSSSSPADNASTTPASSAVRIAVDSGPGLRITEFRARGKDVIAQLGGTLGAGGGRSTLGIRLYPTGLEPGTASHSGGSFTDSSSSSSAAAAATKRVSFRAIALREPPSPSAASPNGTRHDNSAGAEAADECGVVWGAVGSLSYANRGLTEFVFHLADDGRARRLEVPAWQLVLDHDASAVES
jgi:hypothetical protein